MRLWVAGCVVLAACSPKTIDLSGLACDEGDCLPGYFCEEGVCVLEGAGADHDSGDGYRGDALVGDPIAGDPIAGDPIAGDPIAGDPIAGDPIAGDPIAGDPIAGDPIAGDPIAGDPIAGDPIAGDPIAGDPTAGDPIAGDPIAGDPFAGDPLPTLCPAAQRVAVASFSTTSTSFVDVTGGTMTVTPAEVDEWWVVMVSARLSVNNAGVDPEARYMVNGVEHGIGGVDFNTADTTGPWQHFYRIAGTTAVQTIQVQLRTTGQTATISSLRIIAFALPADADPHWQETEAEQSVADGQYSAIETLTFTPSSDGDYLILAIASATESPGGDTIGLRLEDADGAFWPEATATIGADRAHFAMPRAPWQSFSWARAQRLSSSEKTFTLSADGSAGGSNVRYVRILAFRTDAFASLDTVEDVTPTVVTSFTASQISSLTTTAPDVARDHLLIQSVTIGTTVAPRRVTYAIDTSLEPAFNHSVNVDQYAVSYGFFDLINLANSVTIRTFVSTGQSPKDRLIAKESVIHLLGLCVP